MSLKHEGREIDSNLQHGFDTSIGGFDTEVLTSIEVRQPPAGNGGNTNKEKEKEKERLLNISNNNVSGDRVKTSGKCKRREWKGVTDQGEYYFEGRHIPINAKVSGCYLPILKKLFEQGFQMFYQYKRVLFVVVTVSLGRYEDKNTSMTQFKKRLNKRLVGRYGFTHFGYVWAREFSKTNGNTHYHLVWMIDGDLAKKPYTLYQQMTEAAKAGGISCRWADKYHYIDSVTSLEKALYHGTYITKVATKGLRPPQTKDYGGSRLKFVSKLGRRN